ncbi:hypothetical protein HUS23_02645 [Ectothiorhodospiraceae bacterium 2226]|nr:hypothetical protein HUS23_02645 [Ectothiorhodospiraceae bacterium 2226]
MRFGLLILAVVSMAGCATGQVPQTASEFREAFQTQRTGMFAKITRIEVYETSRSFADVYRTLADRAPACLDTTVTESRILGGQMHASRTTFVPKLNQTGRTNAELTIQVPGRVKNPSDGMYIMLVDVVGAAGGGTALTVYGRKAEGYIFDALDRWAAGNDLSCPTMKASA